MKYWMKALFALACLLPLYGVGALAQDEAPTAEERYDALQEAAQEIVTEWRKEQAEMRKRVEAGETVTKAISMAPPLGELIPRFQQAAADYAGTEDAVQFLVWIIRQGVSADRGAAKSAMMTMVDSHLDSEQFGRLASMLPELSYMCGEEDAAALVAKIEKNSKSADVRAWAAFARLSAILEKSELGTEAYESAKKELNAAMEGVKDRYLTSQVAQLTLVREQFSIGAVAPDIEGIDLDGTAFKLSDYKGQVLFVDFWGDW